MNHPEPDNNYGHWTTAIERGMVELAWAMRDKKPTPDVQARAELVRKTLEDLTGWINKNYKGRT